MGLFYITEINRCNIAVVYYAVQLDSAALSAEDLMMLKALLSMLSLMIL